MLASNTAVMVVNKGRLTIEGDTERVVTLLVNIKHSVLDKWLPVRD